MQLAVTKTVHKIYSHVSKNPEIECMFFLFTVRARNVFVNGLFNDAFQVFFSYLGLLYLLKKSAGWSIFWFSVGLSVKLSGALYAVPVCVYFISQNGMRKTLQKSLPGIKFQITCGMRFLIHAPLSYISRSYELTRRFDWFNSVSWKFLPEWIFSSPAFHITLVILYTCSVLYFCLHYLSVKPESQTRVMSLICSCVFSGIIFARSLNYSFYIWYFHLIPFITLQGMLPLWGRIAVSIVLEWR